MRSKVQEKDWEEKKLQCFGTHKVDISSQKQT